MTLEATLAFAVAYFLLVLMPGVGFATIMSRTLGSGLAAGLAVTTGLVIGDFTFIAISVAGMSAIATTMGPLFQVLKYAGAAYLLWLGYQAIMSSSKPVVIASQRAGALWREVGVGLVVTLGNPKPILFYAALVPTFFDITALGAADYAILAAIVVSVSYGVYGVFMVLANRARGLVISTRTAKRINQATGTMLIGSGVLVATR